ncbi:MAG: ATP-dependent DNA helicase [Sphingomonadales bacterium]
MSRQRTVLMPDVPALACNPGGAAALFPDGEVRVLSLEQAAGLASRRPVMVCYAPGVARRLGLASLRAFDVLELFAFVRPARFCLPTPFGLLAALDIEPDGAGLEEEAHALLTATRQLLAELGGARYRHRDGAASLGLSMDQAGWPWGEAVRIALGLNEPEGKKEAGFEVWRALPEWEETGPEPPPTDIAVDPDEACRRLAGLVGDRAEDRPEQRTYAAQVVKAFEPRRHPDAPNLVLAEAGTGVGKTLGYIASASLWAEQNGGAVWLSTYTKNLQRQIDQELDKLYPDAFEKAEKAVIRKGRENYLCLLNFREAVDRARLTTDPGGSAAVIALGLVARWARFSRDGDMVGGDFPAWLAAGLAAARPGVLTDRRGECIYSACEHYRRCFIERAVRKAKYADIVVANHALVMVLAALGAGDGDMPPHFVFDEGHHLFDAADGAFSAHLSGRETAELRRWIRGAEGKRARARGLERRLGELVADDDEQAATLLSQAVAAAAALPGEGWLARLSGGAPQGPAERFLALTRRHVHARAVRRNDSYSLEAATGEPGDDVLAAAAELSTALHKIVKPLSKLRRSLLSRLDDEARDLDSATRVRIEAAARSLARRADMMLAPWRAMLADLASQTPETFVDWFSVDRIERREVDVGLHRHWVDPTRPFAATVLEPSHGALVTSATLRDVGPDMKVAGEARSPDILDPAADHWSSAETRTGALHVVLPASRVTVASPFDYPRQTRIVVVTDLRRGDMAQLAAAYRELIMAANGGALGLFTAIARLREVHARIAGSLDAAGLPLYAQHVDPFDTGTLVDMFRAEEHASLLGTDAVRDGVDVPGRSLRLIVFERVPWPRPTVLHRARRKAFGNRTYDDLLTRLKLKQAYGRLVRRRDDTGVFVILDSAMPSRLASAFPEGVEVARMGLSDAVALTGNFLAPDHQQGA